MAKIKTVDFVPKLNISGDLKKISEYDIAEYNTIIDSIIRLLSMERGSNQLNPELGEKDQMMKIFYSTEDDMIFILDSVQSNLKYFTGYDISINYTLDTNNKELAHIKIDIAGLPGTTLLDMSKEGKFVKTKSPSLFI